MDMKKIKKILKLDKLHFWAMVNALFLALFLVVGSYLDKYETIKGIIRINGFKTIFAFIILTSVFFICLNYLYQLGDKRKKQNKEIKETLLDKHPFLVTFLISIFVSSFYLIFFYPGVLTFDGDWQLNAFFRYWPLNDHHPAGLSLLMGNIFLLGQNLGNDNLGIFIYILGQVIINALVYGYVLKVMTKIKTPKWLRVVTILFFTLFPYLAINSITYMKDTIYYLIFLFLFAYQYYHLEILKDTRKRVFVFLILGYSLLYLWRNTGFYIGVFSTLSIILINLKNKKVWQGMVVVLASILFLNTFYQKVFLPKMGILEGPIREKLSIPLQQTARYLKEYENDVSKEEQEALEGLFGEKWQELARIYDPYRSDNVKHEIPDYPTTEQLSNYFQAWYSMFLKHPLVYIDATLNNTYGYFYSKQKNFMGEEIGFYNITTHFLDVHFQKNTEKGRNMLEDFARSLSNMPIIGRIYACSFYSNILFSLSFFLLDKKKWKFIIYLIPLYLTFLMCLISPVNGHMRYFLPIVVSLPVVLAFLYHDMTKTSKC